MGPGRVDNVSLYAGAATDGVLQLWDTDNGDITGNTRMVTEIKNTANNEVVDKATGPFEFRRGCYVNLSGTTPRGQLTIAPHVAWGSEGAVRGFGQKRKQAWGNM